MEKTELAIRILLIYSILITIVIFACNFVPQISYIGINVNNNNYIYDLDGLLLTLEIITNLLSLYYILKFLFFFSFISNLKLNQPNALRLSIAVGRVAYPLLAAVLYCVNASVKSDYDTKWDPRHFSFTGAMIFEHGRGQERNKKSQHEFINHVRLISPPSCLSIKQFS
ncbi:unnamed protein product [Bursaphelenchus xylophilus]|uniref:(pine wood nematode) hypothetical protein n=1 Tax=Bursaphelenchus xylophilus TaxID=6326 RepID=A0A1I7S556_BURXY|nr:unnamed protein product [Bursaphelenchus xylophilus]CAG9117724.1 unnamed protein product [Bursaphelenchus xylophilus]